MGQRFKWVKLLRANKNQAELPRKAHNGKACIFWRPSGALTGHGVQPGTRDPSAWMVSAGPNSLSADCLIQLRKHVQVCTVCRFMGIWHISHLCRHTCAIFLAVNS